MPPKFISAAQAAERLGVSHRRLLQLIEKKRLPGSEKIGKVWIVPIKAVETFVPGKVGRPTPAARAEGGEA